MKKERADGGKGREKVRRVQKVFTHGDSRENSRRGGEGGEWWTDRWKDGSIPN